MRYVGLLILLVLGACSDTPYTPLSRTHAGDPVFQLNPGMWAATANDLTATPALASGVAR